MSQPQTPATPEVAVNIKNKNLKEHQAEKWEIEAIGDFLLQLYKKQVIAKSKDWIVSKDHLRQEFVKFLRKPGNENFEKDFIELNGTSDIGTLLHRTGYLINTQRGSTIYRIRNNNLCQYRDRKLDEYDTKRKNAIGDGGIVSSDCTDIDGGVKTDDKVADIEEIKFLSYQGSELQVRKSDFSPAKRSCFVCQTNFRNDFEFEEHVAFHSEESNFKFLETLRKFDTSIFKISYNQCKNSHIMRFTLETRLPKVMIEKIILVQSRSFHYLNDARLPYSIEGNDTFYVNSQLFTEFLEQPIIIIFHTNSEDMRLMEQHHFMHFEPFPVVSMNLNSHYLSDEREFEALTTLPEYNPEDDLKKALKNDFPTEYLIKIRPEFYEYVAENKKFNLQNMSTVLKILLQMEDLALRRENYLLLQREVKLRQCGEVYSLKLKYLWWSPDIAGGRLQHLPKPDDEVLLIQESALSLTLKNADMFQLLLEQGFENFSRSYNETEKTFIGRVKRVIEGRVLFVSEQSIPLDKAYIVVIHPLRETLRYQQKALESLDSMSVAVMTSFLFPQNVNKPIVLPSGSLVLQNEGIRDNDEQLQAVRNIIAVEKMEAPYIITGGPGTGKTAVIVESILQLYLRRPDTKILVIAGTDSACDEVALRLCKVLCNMHDAHAIARIYEYPCKARREKIDELLLEYSNLYSKRHFIPAVDKLHEFRILVCTTELIGRLYLGRFGKTAEDQCVFSHVFLDDAAALTEPESLVSVINTLAPQLKLIVAGDPKQLDPLLYSTRAKDLGLSVSLMERLLSCDCYRTDEDGNYNRAILTKLVRNYRGHPKIVDIYNHLYYDNKMISAATKESFSLYERWHRITNPNYPIIFHEVNYSVSGDSNSNDSSCVGTYNSQELGVVLNYVKDLMYNGIDDRKVAQKDIGIISPYKKQVRRIEDQLNLRGWHQIDVGLPEDFQGREKQILIVSFVWSSLNNLDILNNSRRLNSIISRVKSLLILVGNSKVLNQNEDFKYIIDNCRKNKSLEFEYCWQQTKFQIPSLGDSNSTHNLFDVEGIEDNDDNDDDDTHSQCSEVSAAGAKKKSRSRKKKNKGVNLMATTNSGGAITTNQNDKKSENIQVDNQSLKNQTPPENKNNKQNFKNQKPKKNNSNTVKSGIDPIDDFLGSLPNVPNDDPAVMNDIKNMEAEIQERMRKLNIKPTVSAASVAEKTGNVVVDATKENTSKEKINLQAKTNQQQLKVQQQLKHDNAAAAHGQVKRLNKNNQHHQGGQNRANNHDKGAWFKKKDNKNIQEKANAASNYAKQQQQLQLQNQQQKQQQQQQQQQKKQLPETQEKANTASNSVKQQQQQQQLQNQQQKQQQQQFHHPLQQQQPQKQVPEMKKPQPQQQKPNFPQQHFQPWQNKPQSFIQPWQHQQTYPQAISVPNQQPTNIRAPYIPQQMPLQAASYPRQEFYQMPPQQQQPQTVRITQHPEALGNRTSNPTRGFSQQQQQQQQPHTPTPTPQVENVRHQERQRREKRQEEDKCVVA